MSPIIESMKKHPMFQKFCLPVTETTDFRDATYYLRNDGSFVFAEGYYHDQDKPFSERMVISHIVYVPWNEANSPADYSGKMIFGQKYENITKQVMSENPVEQFYPLQLQIYRRHDPKQPEVKPFYARYKAMVPCSELLYAFPQIHTLEAICSMGESDEAAEKIRIITEAMAELLAIPVSQIGISGSVSLGAYSNPHDLDYVIYGSVAEIRRITDYIYNLTSREEERKVWEFGKFWPLRYFEQVAGDKFMVCPFFSYTDEEEIPLRVFDAESTGTHTVEGTVCDHTHNCFNPSILTLENVTVDGKSISENLKLVIYHGGARGDYIEGDKIRACADLTNFTTYSPTAMKAGRKNIRETFQAIVVTNFDQISKI
ncbi:MAG: hypothetical protein CVV64_08085 [Candidatus Wallbacteria bacterium HGW-Wallbacteria-1]|jgi:predicted nucleotidyltransferase|uniref:Polymerase nucleotidyl transferase domain-containing protein n=1 Tax=Candidatus Wallbacteria bacterium HGW-Wallbacteria-1 TaxID=2013854 RepID=A0A2N1PR61_9BACT|nr:MAG: hypothetical protein CVV64_08085 [Candidatus Wallbacteria bacterium HGW-Wallbacteria-1]